MKRKLSFACALLLGMASFTDANAQTAVMPTPYGKQTTVITRDNPVPTNDSLSTRHGNTNPTKDKAPVNGSKTGTVNKNKTVPQKKTTTNSK